mgnify:CR=1 FL=1
MKTCIAICACDRPEWLRELLSALTRLSGGQEFEVIIVDNGGRDVFEVVKEFIDSVIIHYRRLDPAGLSAARNESLRIGRDLGCSHMAFIDDDEVPTPTWLSELVRTARKENADIVYGTVLPDPNAYMPEWLKSSGLLEQFGMHHGTNNLYLRLACLPNLETEWFREEFAFTGGEDYEFLTRLSDSGAVVAKAEKAVVFEKVPLDRTTPRYFFVNRGLRDGVVAVQIAQLKHSHFLPFYWHCVMQVFAKFGYGLNHLFWAPTANWRIVRAGMDFYTAAGIILRLGGMKFHFYGSRN